MDTTWALISWSVPNYIPSDHPIITYEIGYDALHSNNCSMIDYDEINPQVFIQYNKSSNSIFINITGLYGNTCYIFGVRAYTDDGFGVWTFFTNKTLNLPVEPLLTLSSTSLQTSGINYYGYLFIFAL